MLIPSAVKAKAIALLEGQMKTTCIIYKAGTATADGFGGYTNGADVEVETTKCFIGSIGSSTAEREIAAQNTQADLYTVRFPHDADINKNYWMVADSLTYHFVGFIKSDGDAEVYKKAVMRLDQ